MAADLKTLFQSFKTKVGDKLNALNTRINDILIGGISEDDGNSIGWGSDMLPYYRERTPEEIAEDYESLEGVERFTSTHKTNFDGFAEALGNKADLDPVTRKVLPSQLPAMSVTVTGTVNATETTFEDFLTNVNNYTFEDGNAIIIVSAPDVNGDKFTSHYLYNGGDRALETSYSRFNAERVEWEDVVNAPEFALRSEINGGGTTASTELISFTANYQSGLTYNPAATFKEDGITKNDSRQITADPADPSLDRFDLFVIDLTLDQIILIKGTPAANPLYPEYDPLTQIPASFISIQAGATTPTGIVGVNIWTEGSEWSTTGAGASFNFLNTETPASGTYAIKVVTPLTNGQALPFTAPVAKPFEDGMEISYKIKNITGGIYRWLVAGTKANGRQTSLFIDAPFNYSASSTVYQSLSVAIPSGVFSNITKISLVSGVAGLQFYLDDVKLVSGGGAVTGNYVTPEQLEAARLSAIAEANTYTDNGLSLKLNTADYNDRFKGVYLTFAALNTAYPIANSGDTAQVNETGTTKVKNYLWDAEENVWVLSSTSGSGATNTDQLPEGTSNLYFTTARVLATVLTGLSVATGGDIVSTDTVLAALGKIQKQINDIPTAISTAIAAIKEHQIFGTRIGVINVSGTYQLNHNNGNAWDLVMTANTTFSDLNIPTGTNTRVFRIYLTGSFIPTFPTYWTVDPSGSNAYDGTKRNRIVVDITNGTTGSEKVSYDINNL